MKIASLKKLKNGRYKLNLDNGNSIITYDEIIIKNRLFTDKVLDNRILSEISLNNDFYNVYYKIVSLISKKWRSSKEIQDYLHKNEVSLINQEKILALLQKNGLLDDKRFALAYARDAVNLKKQGPYKISSDLKVLGIDEAIIAEVLKELDQDVILANLKAIVAKKQKLNKNKSLWALKNKLKFELMNLGYDSKDIEASIDALKENEDAYKLEYARLMQKYAKKYSGFELEYHVKAAMYKKGFKPQEW